MPLNTFDTMNHKVNRKIKQAIVDEHIREEDRNGRRFWVIYFASTSYPLDLAYMWFFTTNYSPYYILTQSYTPARCVVRFKEYVYRRTYEP